MKIGIIVFSYTGNALSVAKELKKELIKKGHSVNIENIETDGDAQKMGANIKFKKTPGTDDYDALIFGSPVWAFRLSPIMKTYLSGIGPLKGKKVSLFATKALPFGWTGGNRAISQMRKTIISKGGNVIGTGWIIWGKKGPDERMPETVRDIAKRF